MPGNNIFGEAVREELLRMKNLPERASYILMRRVHPLVYRNYVVRAEKPAELMQMVSELGIYGSLVAYVISLVSIYAAHSIYVCLSVCLKCQDYGDVQEHNKGA